MGLAGPGKTALTALLAVALVAVLLLGQAAADRLTPAAGFARTGRLVGRAAFAYLTGLRTFAAAALWSRVEPVYHGYYERYALKEQAWSMPTMRIVLALDPQFVQAYYVAPWVMTERGMVDRGLALARLGVENNPRSGLLHASYAQMLALNGRDIKEAVRQANLALVSDWADIDEEFAGLVQLRLVYEKAGLKDRALAVQREADRLLKLGAKSTLP